SDQAGSRVPPEKSSSMTSVVGNSLKATHEAAGGRTLRSWSVSGPVIDSQLPSPIDAATTLESSHRDRREARGWRGRRAHRVVAPGWSSAGSILRPVRCRPHREELVRIGFFTKPVVVVDTARGR